MRIGADNEQRLATEPLDLSADSLVLSGARLAFDRGDFARATRPLERARPLWSAVDSTPWRLLPGRCRIEPGRCAQAAEELFALARSTPDRGRAAEALYHVGVAHERMDRADVAAGIYLELLERADTPAETRQRATRALERPEG